MARGSGFALVLFGTVFGFVLAMSRPASADAPTAFTECAFVSAGWLPGSGPEAVPKKYEVVTRVPEGWTVVGGTMSTAPALFVCR